jgi:hypothetical protein
MKRLPWPLESPADAPTCNNFVTETGKTGGGAARKRAAQVHIDVLPLRQFESFPMMMLLATSGIVAPTPHDSIAHSHQPLSRL